MKGGVKEPDYHRGSSRRDCGCAGDHGQVVQGQDRGRLHRICGEPELEAGEQIAPVSTFEAPVYTSISMDGKVRLGFHPGHTAGGK